MRSFWPGDLVGRVALVLILAAALQFTASTILFEQAELLTIDEAHAIQAADALETAARVLESTAVPARPAVAQALSRPDLAVLWQALPQQPAGVVGPGTNASAMNASAMKARLLEADEALARRAFAIAVPARAGEAYPGSLRLADGSALLFRLAPPAEAIPAFWSHLASVAVLSAGVLVAALIIVRTLGGPLRLLARAADAIGAGPAVPVQESGPREVRRVALAFNAMQARIGKLIADRTQALAAVSHDLRTPIARMRLRCGLLGEGEDRRSLDADLGEMEGMIAALMAYLGGENDPEKPRPTDVAAILQTLVDAATDAGHVATFAGPARHVLRVRPLSAKRAFANVINNAIQHGGRADVALLAGEPTVIAVDDDGPGIPERELTAVLEPFHRVEAARTGGSGGMGLGLAITRQAVEREGGTIALANRSGGGLRVTIALPPMRPQAPLDQPRGRGASVRR